MKKLLFVAVLLTASFVNQVNAGAAYAIPTQQNQTIPAQQNQTAVSPSFQAYYTTLNTLGSNSAVFQQALSVLLLAAEKLGCMDYKQFIALIEQVSNGSDFLGNCFAQINSPSSVWNNNLNAAIKALGLTPEQQNDMPAQPRFNAKIGV